MGGSGSVNFLKAICCLLGREPRSPALLEAGYLSIIQVHAWWLPAGRCLASGVLGWLAPLTKRSGGEETVAGTEGVCTASLLQEHKHCSVLPWSWGHGAELEGLQEGSGIDPEGEVQHEAGNVDEKI